MRDRHELAIIVAGLAAFAAVAFVLDWVIGLVIHIL